MHEIGHPATGQPALGPDYRDALTEIEAIATTWLGSQARLDQIASICRKALAAST